MKNSWAISALLLTLLIVSAPRRANAEEWRGHIRCITLPGLNTQPLVGEFQMTTNGSQVSYFRPVHNRDSPSVSGIAERGSGTLTGGQLALRGGASGPGYSYTASYQGTIEGGVVNLTGEQVWTALRLSPPQPFHRACNIRLTR